MKLSRSSLILMFVIMPVFGISQYLPMLNQGSEWHHYYWFEASCNHHLIVDGDTTINNIQYEKIINQGDLCNYEYYTFAREDTIAKQVFYHYYDTTEVLIYDFSLKAGDTIKSTFQYYEFEMVVDSISSRLPQYGRCLPPEVYITAPKIFYLSHVNCSSCNQTIWIEGIGNISNPFYSFISWSAGNLGDALLCHFDQTGFRDYHYVFCEEPESCKGPIVKTDEIEKEPLIKFYPNPFSDEVYLEIDDNESLISSIEYYNGLGIRFKSEKEIVSQNIHLSAVNTDLIFVVIRTKNGKMITQKLIKR